MIDLKRMLDEGKETPGQILRVYFDRKTNPLHFQRLRIFYGYCIKMAYIAVNLFTFVTLDTVLNGKFWFYGEIHTFNCLIQTNNC